MLSLVHRTISNILVGPPKPINVFVLGLDGAGKSMLLSKLRENTENEVSVSFPTADVSVETLTISNTTLTCWDVGADDKLRSMWRHLIRRVAAIIFVVDSVDRERIAAAANQLKVFASKDMVPLSSPLLVFANKQDCANPMEPLEVIDRLGLDNIRDRRWCVQPCVIKKNYGTKDGFRWLRKVFKHGKAAVKDPFKIEWMDSDQFFISTQQHPVTRVSGSLGHKLFANFKLPEPEYSQQEVAHARGVAEQEMERFANIRRRRTTLNRWTQRCVNDVASGNDLIESVENYHLDLWDHYNHVRFIFEMINYHIKIRGMGMVLELIDDRIDNYFLNSSNPSVSDKTFNRTLSRFWGTIVAHVYNMMLMSPLATEEEFTFLDFLDQLNSLYPESDDFLPVSEIDDHSAWDITDSDIVYLYYSNTVLYDVEASMEFIAPDKQELPVVV